MIVHKKIGYVPTTDINKSLIVESLLEIADKNSKILLVLEHLMEMPQMKNHTDWLDYWQDIVELVKAKRPQWKVYLLATTYSWTPELEKKPTGFDDMLFIDYHLYRCVNQIIVNKKNPHAYRWPAHQKKFLFLTGEPLKVNRTRLLYKFNQANLLKHAVWSYPDWLSNKDSDFVFLDLLKTLPEFTSDQEIKHFCQDHVSLPDRDLLPEATDHARMTEIFKLDLIDYAHNHSWATTSNWGLHYKVFLYTDTLFSVVSESKYIDTDYPMPTEKTWKAIINNHPFIIAGDTGILQPLRHQGFITFENFLKIPDYDTIRNSEERLNAIVENTKFWVDNLHNYETDIRHRVEHNTRNVFIVYQQTLHSILDFIQRNNLPATPNDLVDVSYTQPFLSIQDTTLDVIDTYFVNFYNAVKDPSWPNCSQENDYHLLPEQIKLELVREFGYVPRL